MFQSDYYIFSDIASSTILKKTGSGILRNISIFIYRFLGFALIFFLGFFSSFFFVFLWKNILWTLPNYILCVSPWVEIVCIASSFQFSFLSFICWLSYSFRIPSFSTLITLYFFLYFRISNSYIFRMSLLNGRLVNPNRLLLPQRRLSQILILSVECIFFLKTIVPLFFRCVLQNENVAPKFKGAAG